MSLHVLEAGLQTLVVDRGRPDHRSLGMPLGGAADRFSWMLGNALVGNPPDAAALEICLHGPTLRADCDIGCAIVGAPFEIHRRDSTVAANRSINLKRGEVLRIAGTPRWSRAYFCVRGGFLNAPVLGSRSSLEPIGRGLDLECTSGSLAERALHWPPNERDDEPTPLRTIPGPQADWFDLTRFFGAKFQVTPASNRMGLRLLGDSLPRPKRELVSEPVAAGAVQVVNDGQCIVLGVDGQTIGGYPKVANVIAADLDRLGQVRPGDEVVFKLVSMDEAETAWRERQRALRTWQARLQIA
jgi:5-oxoprolinase (ATP-hydrolysing) subunit C